MKNAILIPLLLLISMRGFCQWHDMQWLQGWNFENDTSAAETFLMSFDTYPLSITPHPVYMSFYITNLTVSDAAGKLLFYTNGIEIHDAEDELLPNGDSLNPGDLANEFYDGYIISQGIMALPAPSNESQYYLFHLRGLFMESGVPDLLMTVVDMSLNGGTGGVVLKNELIHHAGYLENPVATRHANGRDWWVLTPYFRENKIFRFLLTPEGVVDTATMVVGYEPLSQDSLDTGGQNHFSPDGAMYVDYDALNGIRVYDFDRCTGELSNFRWIKRPYPPVPIGGGVAALSPNSRYFYFSTTGDLIMQADLWANDVTASIDTVAVSEDFTPGQPWLGGFGNMMLAPDGKIYIYHLPKTIHVIYYPNKAGEACEVRQNYWDLPEYGTPVPYYPNYRLGPLDGSACDTLGLDNHPLARFNWEVADTMNPLQVEFTDNSFYEPTDWYWDFGGTGTSTEVNPLYSFPGNGTYQVCLTVSNQYDSDTFCREVTVGVTGTEESIGAFSMKLFPNPASGAVHLSYALPPGQSAEWHLFNTLGQRVETITLPAETAGKEVSLAGLPTGLYFYQLTMENEVVKIGRLVVQAP